MKERVMNSAAADHYLVPLTIALAKLKTVRIRCDKCDTILEGLLEKLHERFASGNCPVCGNPVIDPDEPNAPNWLRQLTQALHALSLTPDLEIEFVLTEPMASA